MNIDSEYMLRVLKADVIRAIRDAGEYDGKTETRLQKAAEAIHECHDAGDVFLTLKNELYDLMKCVDMEEILRDVLIKLVDV